MSDQPPKLIFLIGFMGSGKSHEGDLLAAHLGLSFIDLDVWIEEQQRRTISEIFRTEGEHSFSNIETAVLKQAAQHLLSQAVSAKYAGIISTGGGTPCFHDNMDWMNAHGITVWLNTSVAVIAKRLSMEKSKRPLIANLNDDELHLFIEKKLAERYPYYSKSTLTIDDVMNPSTLTQKITNA